MDTDETGSVTEIALNTPIGSIIELVLFCAGTLAISKMLRVLWSRWLKRESVRFWLGCALFALFYVSVLYFDWADALIWTCKVVGFFALVHYIGTHRFDVKITPKK